MDIFHSLRQLKKIEPNAEYARYSRTKILMETPAEPAWYRRGFRAMSGIMESGSAIALTAAVLFLILGGFSVMRFIETAGGLNGEDLRAEAEAIDIQIQIADVKYSAMPNDAGARQLPQNVFKISGIGSATTSPASPSTTSSAVEKGPTLDEVIDDALLQLSVP